MKAVLLRVALMAMIGLSACSDADRPINIYDGEAKPALWRVEAGAGPATTKSDGVAYIFGTVHLLPDGVNWHGEKIADAEKRSDRLVLEVKGLENTPLIARIFTQMAMDENPPPIARRFPPRTAKRVMEAVNTLPGPANLQDNMESWAVALNLSAQQGIKMGLKSDAGVEAILTTRFRDMGKPIFALEGVQEQFSYFDDLDDEAQGRMLSHMVQENEVAARNFEKMLTIWLRGDPDAIIAGMDDGLLSDPTIRDALLTRRNNKWVVRIADMIDKGERPFVAVGAGHVAGADGVPALLAKMGYKVSRIQ